MSHEPPDPLILDDEASEDGTSPSPGAGSSQGHSIGAPAASRKWWYIGVPIIAAFTGLLVWFGISATVGHPTWATFGYKVVDDREVRVHFDVTRPPGMALVCTVTALATDFSVVGSLEVPVPAATTDQTRVTTIVRTTSRAVTGTVKTCRPA